MTSPPPQHSRTASPTSRPTRLLLVLVVVGVALGAAVLPVVAGLALVVSVVAHRPLLAVITRRYPTLLTNTRQVRPDPAGARDRSMARATVAAGLALIVVGAAQALGALLLGVSVTTVSGIALRTGFALAAEAVMVVTLTWRLTEPVM